MGGWQPHLMDFGLAKRDAGEITMPLDGQVLGTPAYMSPEQARGEGHQVDGRSDVYSLGVILYKMLTGELPFRGNTRMLLHQVLHDEPRPPRNLNDKVPRDLETICLKAMAKEARRRYPSARELADDLRRFLKGEPIQARPVGRLEKAWGWCRRKPALATATALATTALVAVAVISLLYASEQARSNRDLLAEQKKTLEEKAKAEEEETKAKQSAEAEKKARAQLEEALARSLLGPLGHGAGPVSDPEIRALWELSASSDRVRLLFVEQALQDQVTARQLRNRADLALHAAVGLDPVRRQRVEEVLLARLRDPNSDFRIREDCVFIGQALDGYSREFAGVAAWLVVDAMGKTTDPAALNTLDPAALNTLAQMNTLAQTLAGLAPRLEAKEAAQQAGAAVRPVLQAMGKPTAPGALYSLGLALENLAPWLEPEQAGAAARLVVEVMGKATSPHDLHFLAQAVAALASRLEAKAAAQQAAATARLVLQAMGKTTDPTSFILLVRVVAAVAPWLEPEQAGAAAWLVLQKTAYEPTLLSRAVAALIVMMDSGEISQRGRLLAATVGHANAPVTLLVGLAPLAEASRPLPGRFSEQQLVDFLKMPTCPQPARQVLVAQLGHQCGRPFADLWEFVAWARVHRPDLDLTSPPVRPPKP